LIRRSRLPAEIAVLTAVIVALAVTAYVVQKVLFRRRGETTDITRSMDEALGPLILRQVELSQTVLSKAAVDKAFSTIMGRLQPALDQLAPGSPRIRIVVIDDPAINAFTLPGGIICVYTGLMRKLDSAEQMSGILGHELCHAVHRDPLALLARQMGVAALTGILTGGRGGEIAGRLVQTLVNVHYGRKAEDRADDFSVHLLALAGIDPFSFAQALQRIEKAEPNESGLLLWIDTHSPIQERIERARREAATLSATPRRIDVGWQSLLQRLSKTEE